MIILTGHPPIVMETSIVSRRSNPVAKEKPGHIILVIRFKMMKR
jgi:hypothetical protein